MVKTTTVDETAIPVNQKMRAGKRHAVQTQKRADKRSAKRHDKLEARIQRSEEVMRQHGTLSAEQFLEYFAGRLYPDLAR